MNFEHYATANCSQKKLITRPMHLLVQNAGLFLTHCFRIIPTGKRDILVVVAKKRVKIMALGSRQPYLVLCLALCVVVWVPTYTLIYISSLHLPNSPQNRTCLRAMYVEGQL